MMAAGGKKKKFRGIARSGGNSETFKLTYNFFVQSNILNNAITLADIYHHHSDVVISIIHLFDEIVDNLVSRAISK